MKRFGLWCVIWAAALSGGAAVLGQTAATPPAPPVTTVTEPPAPLLPANAQLVANDTAANVPPDRPETPGVMIEDALKRTETRAVMKNGSPVGWVRAYQFVDATGALSAFTFFRQGGRPHRVEAGTVQQTELPDGEVILLDGVSVVRLGLRGASAAEAASLLSGIQVGLPKVSGRRGLAPLLPTLLPEAGLDRGTLKYALGPTSYQEMGGVLPPAILGWDKSAEVATANYAGRAGHGTLTLLLYPTPQIAGIVGRAIEQAVNQAGPEKLGTVKLRRVGPLVAMTSGAWTTSQAEALVNGIHLNQEVTFDQKKPLEFHAEIRKTYTLLQSIAIFTGIAILAALVLGVFLGGARAGIRVLQGKPAASEPEFLTIDLRGAPKPLAGNLSNNEADPRAG